MITEQDILRRHKAKARSWLYRLRQGTNITLLGSADFKRIKLQAEYRLKRSLTWDEFIRQATLDELMDLDDLRNELRAGI